MSVLCTPGIHEYDGLRIHLRAYGLQPSGRKGEITTLEYNVGAVGHLVWPPTLDDFPGRYSDPVRRGEGARYVRFLC
jgi:hypothetical protein